MFLLRGVGVSSVWSSPWGGAESDPRPLHTLPLQSVLCLTHADGDLMVLVPWCCGRAKGREGGEGVEQVCCGRAESSGGGGEECPGECSSLNPGGYGNQQKCSGSV